MGYNDTLKGAENAYTVFFLYLSEVVEKIGMEQAIALSTTVDKTLGTKMGAMLKIEADFAEFDVRTVATIAQNLIEERFGILSEIIEDRPDHVAFQIRACPVYRAALNAGLDHRTIEAFCQAGPLQYMNALVKTLNGDLSYWLRNYRTKSEGYCEEAVVRG